MTRTLRCATACSTLLLAAGCLSGPWPGRPPRWDGAIQKPLEGQDPEIIAKLAGPAGQKGDTKYPAKYYWVAAPDWRPVRQSGNIVGRHTSNAVIARITRLDGSGDHWPDLCEYDEITLVEEASDPSATKFDHPDAQGSSVHGEVDCSVYDAAPGAR